MADYRCARCQWGDPMPGGPNAILLVCRKNAPTALGSGRTLWPYVERTDWCGQFSPKRQAPWTATVEEPRGPE